MPDCEALGYPTFNLTGYFSMKVHYMHGGTMKS